MCKFYPVKNAGKKGWVARLDNRAVDLMTDVRDPIGCKKDRRGGSKSGLWIRSQNFVDFVLLCRNVREFTVILVGCRLLLDRPLIAAG